MGIFFLFVQYLVIGVFCCLYGIAPAVASDKNIEASNVFNAHCAVAGESIKRTVENVDGIFIMKLRPDNINYAAQFDMDDPYGRDLRGLAYLETFLREFYDLKSIEPPANRQFPRSHFANGYKFVEAVNPADGRRYKYTGLIEQPWEYNKKYLHGYFRFVMSSTLADGPSPDYGVTFFDISTNDDRALWIAGSALQIIDLRTNEIIAERIGYFYDPAQGSTAAGRSPWLMAASYSCPSFGAEHAFSNQLLQTARFVEKVLHPTKGK